MLMSTFDRVNIFFLERHISLKENWLRCALEYVRSITGTNDVHAGVIYELWKYSEIKESTNPCITESIRNAKDFNGVMVLQIQAITDIGSSYLSQFKKLVYVATDNAEFQSNDIAEQPEKECGSRLLQLLLSDGVSQIKAVEYKRVDQLSLLICPGSKIIIHGYAKTRRDIFLLKPENCQLLGGDVEALMRTNRPVEIMGAKLKLPISAQQRQHSHNNQSDVDLLTESLPRTTNNNAGGGVIASDNVTLPTKRPDLMTRMNAASIADRIATVSHPQSVQQLSNSSLSVMPSTSMRNESTRISETANFNVTKDGVRSHVTKSFAQADDGTNDFLRSTGLSSFTKALSKPSTETDKVNKPGVTSVTNDFTTTNPSRKRFATDLKTLRSPQKSFDIVPTANANTAATSDDNSLFSSSTQQLLQQRQKAVFLHSIPQQQQPAATTASTTSALTVTDTMPTSTTQRDSEAHFGEYVASLLRAMPVEKRNEKRAKIFAVLNSD